MPVTTTAVETLKAALNQANPNKIADALQRMQLGTMLTPLKKTFTGLDPLAAHDLTDEAHGFGPAALLVTTLRVTAGDATAGPRAVVDSGGTPATIPTATGYTGAAIGLATISDDGKTITFDDDVTGFVIEYVPRSAVDMTAAFTRS